MSRQGKRLDITCAPEEHKLKGVKSRDILAEQSGESRETIRRYIRLTELIPEILEMVDDKKISMRPAYNGIGRAVLFDKRGTGDIVRHHGVGGLHPKSCTGN